MADSPHLEKLLSAGSRIAVWAFLLLILYILRAFFLLLFLTFVFAYLQAHGVSALERFIRPRTLRVVLVAVALLALISGLLTFLVPQIREQAVLFASKFPSYLQAIDRELATLTVRQPVLAEYLPPVPEIHSTAWDPKASPAAALIQQILGVSDSADIGKAINFFQTLGTTLLGIVSAFLLSLLFSFLIVLDLPALSLLVKRLACTKLSFFYEEVAGSIHSFGTVLGRALEAQLMIAVVNTALTAVAINLMGIGEKAAFLSMIVFLFSFVPVAGVFISSIPICVVALQESGLPLVFIAIGVVTVIHLIEAYVLNPKIYGHHLHLNPVIVLIILTIAGKIFGGWGLVLGVPVCTYIFGHAIKRSAELVPDHPVVSTAHTGDCPMQQNGH